MRLYQSHRHLLLLLFLLPLMPPLQRMRTRTATTLMTTVRMILIVLSWHLQNKAGGQRTKMPLWLLLSELAKKLTQFRLREEQGVLPIIVFKQQERKDWEAQR